MKPIPILSPAGTAILTAVRKIRITTAEKLQNGKGKVKDKGNYDVSANYTWWRNNWNDMATPYEEGLRNIVLVLGSRDGVLDTLEWEGIREGADDIRYATLIQQLARPLLNSQTNVPGDFAARQALKFLADLDTDDHDLSTVRLEMIRHILNLMKHSK